MGKSFIEQSKIVWEPLTGRPAGPHATNEEIIIGCAQRIATAVETVAQNYNALITDRDFYKRRYYEQQKELQTRDNRIAGLKGEITKLRKREAK